MKAREIGEILGQSISANISKKVNERLAEHPALATGLERVVAEIAALQRAIADTATPNVDAVVAAIRENTAAIKLLEAAQRARRKVTYDENGNVEEVTIEESTEPIVN